MTSRLPMPRSKRGRALFYSRDSSGRNEMTPAQYVAWAQRLTAEKELTFDGTGERISQLISSGLPSLGDLFFDNAISGNQLDRPGLAALKSEVKRDQNVSHIFIPRRDRLARPDQPTQGIELERELRQLGVTIQFMNAQYGPVSSRQRLDLGESLAAFIDYHQSGLFRDELAEKMIFAQLELAKNGFSTGGRPPFGFRRFLIGPDLKPIRELQEGEIVRQRGHHVVWLPGPQVQLDLISRILRELVLLPASRLARKLNEEGIPSPDAGRHRKDGGVFHTVSGKWHQSTITNIARHPLLRAITQYGLRSMGEQRRLTLEGPRPIDDTKDLRADGQPKVIRNEPSQRITAPAHGEAVVPVDQVERVIDILDQRAGKQRGKPRSRDPGKNPLGSRVFDMACCWPMYRTPRGQSFHYTCGYYQQSHGQACSHNHVDGIQLTQFALATIRQRLLRPGLRDRLEAKIRCRLQEQAPRHKGLQSGTEKSRQELAELEKQYTTAVTNMTLEPDPAIKAEMRTIVVDLQTRINALKVDLQREQNRTREPASLESKVTTALQEFDDLPKLANDPENLAAIGELFSRVDVQLFLRFQPIQLKKRTVNRLSDGIITLGAVPAPIQKYSGATTRSQVKDKRLHQNETSPAETPAGLEITNFADDQVKSSGNVNRDDRIRTCDFLVPNQAL